MRPAHRAAVLAAAAILTTHPAHAHLAATGLGPLYDGAWHLLLTPAQGLILTAVALHAGLAGPAPGRAACILVPLFWLSGLALLPPLPPALAAPLSAALLLAAGAALALRLPAGAAWAAGIALGALTLGAAYDGDRTPLAILGASAVVATVMPLAASISLPLRRLPAITAVRVAGSWMAALGLLLLGWWVRGHQA